MKHRINNCPVNLRTLSTTELEQLISATVARNARVQEELESLVGERIRRGQPSLHLVP